jgi:uncharacterized membrane protein
MAEDNNDNILLEYPKRIRGQLNDIQQTQSEHGIRLSNIEQELAHQHGRIAEQSVRFDRVSERLGRIERRLELLDDA